MSRRFLWFGPVLFDQPCLFVQDSLCHAEVLSCFEEKLALEHTSSGMIDGLVLAPALIRTSRGDILLRLRRGGYQGPILVPRSRLAAEDRARCVLANAILWEGSFSDVQQGCQRLIEIIEGRESLLLLEPPGQGNDWKEQPKYRELQEKFLTELSTSANCLETQILHDHYQEAAAIAHRMKGSASTLGFPRLGDLGHSLEEAVRAKHSLDSQNLLAQFREELDRTRRSFDRR